MHLPKTPVLLLVLLALLPRLAAAEDPLAALRAADDERVAATLAADRSRLAAIYSDDLHYAHSNGRVDTKASQIDGVAGGPNRYTSMTYRQRTFTPAGPGIALMTGNVLVAVSQRATGQTSEMDLVFLAVWRQEGGKWRFLAWQSCRRPDSAAAARK